MVSDCSTWGSNSEVPKNTPRESVLSNLWSPQKVPPKCPYQLRPWRMMERSTRIADLAAVEGNRQKRSTQRQTRSLQIMKECSPWSGQGVHAIVDHWCASQLCLYYEWKFLFICLYLYSWLCWGKITFFYAFKVAKHANLLKYQKNLGFEVDISPSYWYNLLLSQLGKRRKYMYLCCTDKTLNYVGNC